MDTTMLQMRVFRLERRVRTLQIMLIAACLSSGFLAWAGQAAFGTAAIAQPAAAALAAPAAPTELTVSKLTVVDGKGRPRVIIAEDPPNTQRRARSAGISVFDEKGSERGGIATFADGSVVFALDAPRGIGDPMPDRVGIGVDPDGGSHVMLLDNRTRAVVRLHSDGMGGGGCQTFKWDMQNKKIHVKTHTYDGDKNETRVMGG